MNDRDILKLDVPKENQPLDYYRKFLRHIDPMLNILEIRLGYTLEIRVKSESCVIHNERPYLQSWVSTASW
jgi:hypothetical protein